MNKNVVSVQRVKSDKAALTLSPEVYFQMESNPVENYIDLEEESGVVIETMVNMTG